MTCEPIRGLTKDGQVMVGIVCSKGGRGSRTKCSEPGCGARGTLLCDWPPNAKRESETCSRPLCGRHAKHEEATGKDYCSQHAPKSGETLFDSKSDPLFDAF